MNVRQTSDREYGQIYISTVNWTMMVCTLALAYGFGSSSALAGAYGMAVSATMLLTTVLLFAAMRQLWRWRGITAALVCGVLLMVDLAFFGANLLKLPHGGWAPLVLASLVLTIMLSWRRGTDALHRSFMEREESIDAFLARLKAEHIPRVPGTAVFLSRTTQAVSPVMVRHVAQIKALQGTVISLTVSFDAIPRIPEEERTMIEPVAEGFWHVTVRFGFVEAPNLPAAMAHAKEQGCPLEADDVVYFGAHDEVVQSKTRPRLPAWQRLLFAFMFRNAVRTSDRFVLPPEKFLAVGRQVAL
jgi:KUP system potassium uptake protein